MINCRYIGTRSSNGHPYLIGTFGYCNEDTVNLINKYQNLKNDGKSINHKKSCECQKCIDLAAFGCTMVEYTINLDDENEDMDLYRYRVHIKHIELTHE